MTRQEHLNWCKQRALEYLEAGDLPNAVASMMSDLGKHPDMKDSAALAQGPLGQLGIMDAMAGDAAGVRRWIDGFN